jgi:formate dehydrogenase major subunit
MENAEKDRKDSGFQLTRRDFLKLGTAAFAVGALSQMGAAEKIFELPGSELPTSEKMQKYKAGKQTPSICPYCAGGCGLLVTSIGGKVVEIEGDPYHPINEGAACAKLAAYIQLVNSSRRILYPMKRTNPKKGINEDPGWVRITWDEAYQIIAAKVKEAMAGLKYKQGESSTGAGEDYYVKGIDSPIGWYGSAYWNNEENYLAKKLASTLFCSLNIDHQARKCHASTVTGLANTFGFGAMTNHIVDAKNSKVFLIMSNPAESHSMEFRWVRKAIDENGAKVIVLDPRYNKTTSQADIYAKYRSGSEAAFWLGMIKYIIDNKRWDDKFVNERTNAPYDLNGNKVGIDHPDSIFSKLKEIVKNYTTEEVVRITGIPQDKLLQIYDVFTDPKNRPGNIYYAMGTTQHTNATQAIRAYAIVQLLLGNMGVPGGGVNALRGISNVQGSTDMNVLAHLIMGYRSPPANVAEIRRYQKWKNGLGPGTTGDKDADAKKRGGNLDPARVTYPYAVPVAGVPSEGAKTARYDDRHFPTWNALEYHWGLYIGTWPGKDPDNEPVVCDLPVGIGNPTVQFYRAIADGKIKVAFIVGDNSAVSVSDADRVRAALSKEGFFLVVYELFETETAHYADILLPGTTQCERSGSITNTGRWIQWRWKGADPPGECKPELEFMTELGRILRKYAGLKTVSERFEAEKGVDIKRQIGGVEVQNNWDAHWPSTFGEGPENVFKEIAAKSTGLGPTEFIIPGLTTNLPQNAAEVLYRGGYNPTLRPDLDGILPKRRDKRPVDEQDAKYGYFKNWAWAWFDNQRVMYNLNETNPGFKTFLAWWGLTDNLWLGADKAAIFSPPLYSIAAANAWAAKWPGVDAKKNPFYYGFPLHNEPLESPDRELAAQYPTMWDKRFEVKIGTSDEYPYVLTTFRLAEHMQAGAMTRNLPYLVELHPEMFIEINSKLAAQLGIKTGDRVRVKSARKPEGIIVRAIVTERLAPLIVNGREVHVVAMPWHWGFKGLSTGASANEVCIDAVDVTANIPEYKTCLVKVEKA